jgi:peptide/nickel transport system ATP-binding protein
MTLLDVRDLRVEFASSRGTVRAADGVSFAIARGETLALLGESGCGKSVTALAVDRLLPANARIAGGEVRLDGLELLALPERDMRAVRGRRIGMIFQEPQSALNPVMTIGHQIMEALPDSLSASVKQKRAIEWLERVGISDAGRCARQYPHELSGGMKQRAGIAIALAPEPALVLADEPTTALDVTIQAQILEILKELRTRTGMALLFITHDLAVAAQVADRIAVMYAGQIVDIGVTKTFFDAPGHPYTQGLLRALPSMGKRGAELASIPGMVPSLATEFTACRFASRCPHAWELCRTVVPPEYESGGRRVRCHLFSPTHSRTDNSGANVGAASAAMKSDASRVAAEAAPTEASRRGAESRASPLLQARDLKVWFPIRRGVFQRTVAHVRAVDGVSFDLEAGRTLALVGESGCGKTTTGRAVLHLVRPTAGEIHFDGTALATLDRERLRQLRARMQIVFQDPYASLNPRMLVSRILEEGMRAHGIAKDHRQARIAELLAEVGLPADAAQRYPHEFSGGQRQRLSIARALTLSPELIVCDEPTSALDVSVQAQILNLLRRLQSSHGLSYLFITHNLAVVEYLAHEVAVMYLGRIVERGTVDEVLRSPRHPYTQALLASAPSLPVAGADTPGARPVLKASGELPSPVNPPSGCHFHPRCPHVMPKCREVYPGVSRLTDTHTTHCYLYPA